jgi:hypothetical protein
MFACYICSMEQTVTTLTWFGGHAGVLWNADRYLHLVNDDRTYCGIRDGLRPVTRREANSAKCPPWCPTCFERAQAS